jgi:hypothetical protein
MYDIDYDSGITKQLTAISFVTKNRWVKSLILEKIVVKRRTPYKIDNANYLKPDFPLLFAQVYVTATS